MATGRQAAKPAVQDKTPRPTRVLPTNRIAFQKQLDTLRAFGGASDPNGKPVQLSDLAGIVSLHANTLSLINPFFVDIQFVQRGPEGLVPAPEVIDFSRAYDWNKYTAAQRLAPIILKSWFAQLLIPKLRFRAIAEDEAIQDLATAATAGPSYRGQIQILLEYMQAAGLVTLENGQVRLQQGQSGQPPSEAQRQEPAAPASHAADRDPAPRHSPVATSFANPTAGVVQFQVSVKVDMAEFAGWDPQRISSFFSGIAQVLAAKGAIEEQTSGM